MNQKLGIDELIEFCNNKKEMNFTYNILKSRPYLKDSEDIEDILQEGITRTFEWINTEKGKQEGFRSIRGFILQASFNYTNDLLRSRKVHAKNLPKVDFEIYEVLTPYGELVVKEHNDRRAKILEKCLEVLPKEQRKVIEYQLEGLEFQEMAVIENENVNTPLSRAHYARRTMKKLLHPAA